MKVGDIVICLVKGTGDLSSIDKILEFVPNGFESQYIHIADVNLGIEDLEFEKCETHYGSYKAVVLDDYFKEPTKYEDFYKHHDDIQKLWKKFMEMDTVEARKYKLKILGNL